MENFSVETRSRTDFINITSRLGQCVNDMGVDSGVVTVFVPHTTAGITINENADPDVMTDVENILDRIMPWKDGYLHAEGNSAAHVKASLVGSSVCIPVENGRLQLGTWQGIYLCEFDGSRKRSVWVAI